MARGDWPEPEGSTEDGISRRWKAAGLAAAVVAFLLISAAIHVSTFEVKSGTRVFGPAVLVPDRPAALRTVVWRLDQGEPARELDLEAVLVGPGEARATLGRTTAGPTRTAELNFRLPGGHPEGEARLELEVRADELDAERVPIPVRVEGAPADTPEALRWRPACEEGSRPRQGGGWTPAAACRAPLPLRAYPEGGHLVGNLENRVILWAPDRAGADAPLEVARVPPPPMPGQPRPAPAAAPTEVRFDALGLGELTMTPSWPREDLLAELDGRPVELWLRDLPTQILATARRPLLRPGERPELALRLVRDRAPVYLDVWSEAGWIGADSAGIFSGGALDWTLALPDDAAGLVQVRAYTQVDAPAAAQATASFWVHPAGSGPEALRALARRVAGLSAAAPLAPGTPPPEGPEPLARAILEAPDATLARLSPRERQRAAAALLSRVTAPGRVPPRLVDTTAARQEALETFKRRVRRPLMAGLTLLAAGVVLGAGWLVVQGWVGVRRRLAELDLDEVAPEAGETRPRRVSASGALFGAAALLFVVGAAVLGVLILLETLRWDWGR